MIVPIPSCRRDLRAPADALDVQSAPPPHVIFGDLFLEDVRAYRESKLAGTGIAPLFPLWQRPTQALAREMIGAGIETYLVCVDLKQLPNEFAGRRFDRALLADLPATADPCGEKGEFPPASSPADVLRRIDVRSAKNDRTRWFAYRLWQQSAVLPASPKSETRIHLCRITSIVMSGSGRIAYASQRA